PRGGTVERMGTSGSRASDGAAEAADGRGADVDVATGSGTRVAPAIVGAYLWIMMILLGAIVLETFMVYPNIFADPPRTLELGMEFLSVRAPNDFFPPFGFASWVLGVAAVVAGWRLPSARPWLVASVAMILCEGIASMTLFWPRNTIMFVEGTGVHSAEYLRQVAREFETLHWLRLVFNALSAAFVFVGFLRVYRARILAPRTSDARVIVDA
ncbi:MAG TPA: hypothetical protein VK891_01735, partial [Euzebyales bacterium]|nr:hypothetical protein [Euzebyales bacterium]